MRPAARYFAASVVAVALGAAPGLAQAQSTGSTSGSSQGTTGTQSGSSSGTSATGGTTSTQTATPPSSSTGASSSSGGIDEAAAREHLSQARQALADLTKLPAATQLQGDQRTQVANFIQSFNAFATATTDWRSKFQAVEQQLDQILATADASNTSSGTAGTAGSSATTAPSGDANTSGATGASGTAASAAGYDPTIIAKLREVKTHLDAFQEASGDPTPHYDAIEKIIDSALNGGSGSSSVGTSGTAATGTTGDASASGSVTLTRAQLEEIRQHVEKLRAASNAAMAKQQ